MILEPVTEPSSGIFVEAGPSVTEPILGEAKRFSDKAMRLLEDLGVRLG